MPEELTQLRMGKIVRERYPELSAADQEAVRQHAVAAINITKLALAQADAEGVQGNTALLDGVRKFVNVRDLEIDLIDRINPFRRGLLGVGESDGREVVAPGAGRDCREENQHLRGQSPRTG